MQQLPCGLRDQFASSPPWRALRGGAHALVDLVFPPRCTCCRAELASREPAGESAHVMVCEACRQQIVGARLPRCARCGETIVVETTAAETTAAETRPAEPSAELASATSCAACRGVRLRFDRVLTLGDYRGPLRQVVLRMKRIGQEPLSLAMGELLFSQRETQLAALEADVLVPVPMHWSRRLLRGANSPELVAAALSRRLRIPVARRALVRRRNTRQQGSLLRGQRFANIRGAFKLGAGYDLAGACVLLVDDVITTGATCSEAAATLRRGGAATVAVAVVARAQSGV